MPKNILVISPVPTHPPIAGNRARISTLISNINSCGHNVYFLYINKISGDLTEMKRCWGDHFFNIPYKQQKNKFANRTRKLKKIFRLKGAYTYKIDEWYDSQIDQYIQDIQKKIQFDVVIVEYVFFSKALSNFSDEVIKIIDTHDVFTNRHILHLKQGVEPKWFSTAAKEEKKGLSRADVVIAIQDKDAKFFEKMLNDDCEVISVGHIIELHQEVLEASHNNRILIIASNNASNLHATNHFMNEIFPEIKKAIPNVEVALVGTLCDLIEDQKGLKKIGKVDDLSSMYGTATIVVNPVTFGTGLKIKTIEALGYSKPLVTTPVGAEGLEDGNNIAFLIAHSKIEFAEKVINVLTDLDLRESLSLNAYKFARKWNQNCMSQLERLLN